MLVLHVERAVRDDIGLYTCSRPTYFHHWRPQGHVAHVGIICKYLERIKYEVKMCYKYTVTLKILDFELNTRM